MDEPTASLSAHEVKQLFAVVSTLRDQGVAILFISHRLEEVLEIADRITVLRDGEHVSTTPAGEVTTGGIIRDMVGREMGEYFAQGTSEPGEVLMSVRGLGKDNAFSDISFDIRRGEVLGFAGLVGSRRTDVALALFGIEPADAGQVHFDGTPLTIRSPEQAMEHGIAYLCEDRRQLGLVMPMSITSNISVATLHRYLNGFGLVRRRQETATAEEYRQRLSIRTPSVDHEVGKLSGGNQQKVMLSKWLNTLPKLFIFDEPTRGIDIGAKAEVHHMIHELAAQGLAIILISSDLPEVLAMSDRILVMREGRQMGIFDRDDATQETIMSAAMGQNALDQEVVQ
jgi:rhamnose transport system ATP-binding protein